MFGLTFEKLFLVAIVAGVVIGPARLPVYAQKLADTVRALRGLVETSRARAEHEIGVAGWPPIDPRQYDPRRIVREALDDSGPASGRTPATDGAEAGPTWSPELLAEASRVRPGQLYLVTGSAAHPRRMPIASLPHDDPRRVAAYVPGSDDDVDCSAPAPTQQDADAGAGRE